MLKSVDPNNQEFGVNPVLGFQVKSDSISTDSVSINENNELEDNMLLFESIQIDLKYTFDESLMTFHTSYFILLMILGVTMKNLFHSISFWEDNKLQYFALTG